MSATRTRYLHRTLLLAGASALALAVGACSGALKESAEREGGKDGAGAAALVRIGDASRAGGDLATAIGFYQRASIAAPNDAGTQLRLATALLEMGSYGESEAAFRRVLEADPENLEAMRGLGNVYIATDQPAKAVEQFQNLIARKPSYQAFNGLGVAYDLEGKHAAAQKAYHSGLAENATSLTLKNNLGLSLALSGDYHAAVDLLRRVSRHPQATIRHRQNLALVYGLAGDTAHAAEIAKIDLDAKAVESNLAYYAWLRAQPKLSPSDVMRYSGPNGKGGVPAIEEGARPADKAPVDIGATASIEPVAAPGTTLDAAPRTPVVEDRAAYVAAAPRPGAIEPAEAELDDFDHREPADAELDAEIPDADAPELAHVADDADVEGEYVLLPEERAARTGQVIGVVHTVPRPAPRPTTHFRDMSYAQFARAVGIYGPACEDDYRGNAPSIVDGPATYPTIDRNKPVVASVAGKVNQPIEPVAQVAYDSTITLEGLRRY